MFLEVSFLGISEIDIALCASSQIDVRPSSLTIYKRVVLINNMKYYDN